MLLAAGEKDILRELERMHGNNAVLSDLIREGFYGGVTECQLSKGTYPGEVFLHFAEQPSDDPALAVAQAKALGWFTRGLKLLPFLQTIANKHRMETISQGVAILREKGFSMRILDIILTENFRLLKSDPNNRKVDFDILAESLKPLQEILNR